MRLIVCGVGIGILSLAIYIYGNLFFVLHYWSTPSSVHECEIPGTKGLVSSPEHIGLFHLLNQGGNSLQSPQLIRETMKGFGELSAKPTEGVLFPSTNVPIPGQHLWARYGKTLDDKKKVILYLHGGGYIAGSPTIYGGFLSTLSRATETVIFAIDYRLAPENPLPAAVEDALAAYIWLSKEKDRKIVIMGDSAGGGLSALLLLEIVKHNLPQPAGTVLISPYGDLTSLHFNEAEIFSASDPLCRSLIDSNDVLRSLAVGRYDNQDLEGTLRQFSPSLMSWKGVTSPVLLIYSSVEVLSPACQLIVQRANEAGVDITVYSKPLIHVWVFATALIPESYEGIGAIDFWLKTKIRI